MQKKVRGRYAEEVAVEWLQVRGLRVCDRNRTMRGGELDIVGYLDDLLVVVEVRCIDSIQDIHGYISSTKMKHLIRSTTHRVHLHKRSGPVRVDVVYVKGDNVAERFQDITNA